MSRQTLNLPLRLNLTIYSATEERISLAYASMAHEASAAGNLVHKSFECSNAG
jgi:hypothetical protein